MTNKSIATALRASLIVAIVTGVLSDSLAYSTESMLYTLSGLGMVIFGFWGASRLSK